MELVIRGGKVYDGTGAAPRICDVGIEDGVIVRVGEICEKGEREIDAKGLCVTPGFIDSHSHTDGALFSCPAIPEVIEQGITTSVQGQCGASVFPARNGDASQEAAPFFQKLRELKTGPNFALLAGHGNLRRCVMGKRMSAPTPSELEQMKKILEEAMKEGALGLSFGLAYVPGIYAEKEELIELAKVVASYGGVIACHLRDEGARLEEAAAEFIDVARKSGARAVISHFKACKKENHGKAMKNLVAMDKAVSEGLEIYGDVYPYTATSTAMRGVFLDKKFLSLPDDRIIEELKKKEVRAEQRALAVARHGEDLSFVLVVNCPGHKEFEGLRVPEIAERLGLEPYEAVYRVLMDSKLLAKACYFSISEEEMKKVMAHDRVMIGTDGGAVWHLEKFHPRARATFPRAVGKYCREEKVVPLEEMIRKCTSLPAQVYGFTKKGKIEEGMDADLCIFDFNTIRDRSTYAEPNQRAKGLNYVIVGGKIAAENAVHTDALAGSFLPRGKA